MPGPPKSRKGVPSSHTRYFSASAGDILLLPRSTVSFFVIPNHPPFRVAEIRGKMYSVTVDFNFQNHVSLVTDLVDVCQVI